MRVRRAVVATVVVTALAGSWSAGAQETRTVDEHRQRLVSAAEVAEAGIRAPSPDRMREVRTLVGQDVVLIVDDHRIALGADPFLSGLEGTEPEDFRAAATHAGTLRSELDALVGSDPVQQDRLDAALARSYDGVDPSLAIRERVMRAIGDALARILEPLLRNRGTTSTVASVLLLLLGLGLVLWLARRLRVVPDAREPRRSEGRTREVDWRRMAADALARGDLEAALRAEYRVLLHVLDARGVVDDAPSLTAAECRSAVARTQPGLAGPVRQATDAFERVAYGDQPVRREDVDAVQRAEREAART